MRANAHQAPSDLFFGLIAPIGIGGGTITKALREALREVAYETIEIRIIQELERLKRSTRGRDDRSFSLGGYSDDYQRYSRCMTVANRFCQTIGLYEARAAATGRRLDPAAIEILGQSALARLAVVRATELRLARATRRGANIGTPRRAHIFRSLKRKGELLFLQHQYTSAFFVIAAYTPKSTRLNRLAEKIASTARLSLEKAKIKAAELIEREQDESEVVCGQSVRQAFSTADYFMNASGTIEQVAAQMKRLVHLIFAHPFETPTPDEQGMAMAFMASFRSAHWSRQVGASITAPDGSLVAVGANEVPKALGGAYWHGDPNDQRDHQLKQNTSFEVRQEVLGDLLERCETLNWLNSDIKRKKKRSGAKKFHEDAAREHLREARVMDALEFDRSVHAEMLAITDAARRGVSLAGCTLYTTAFPCHNCARHIVSAGIRRVVFLDPYEKSLAERLHVDSLGVDLSPATGRDIVRFDPYIGVAPSRYPELFGMTTRKGTGEELWKRAAEWPPERAEDLRSRLWANAETIRLNEIDVTRRFVDALSGSGFVARSDVKEENSEEEEEYGRARRRRGRARTSAS